MRRDGELIAYRPDGAREYYYPLWQFDDEWQSAADHPTGSCVRRRPAACADNRLYEVLSARAGIGGGKRLGECLREGRVDHVLDAIRSRVPSLLRSTVCAGELLERRRLDLVGVRP